MMGPSHAVSGLAAGALALPLAADLGIHDPLMQAAWIAAWGGFAYLPDLDQHGSTAGSMWGPVTRWLSRAIGVAAVRHRGGTHDLIVAPLAFGAAAVLASRWHWPSLLFLAFAVGLALRALAPVIPGKLEDSVVGNVALSAAATWWVSTHAHGPLTWLPVAVAGGVIVHIAGDWLTTDGVPVPFTTWGRHPRTWGLRAFDAGRGPEPVMRVVVFPLLLAVGVWMNTGVGVRLLPVVHAVRAVAQAAT